MKKIILLGYMGCGKSTIGKKLSEITNIPFLDLDDVIEKETKTSINSIFKKQGEIYFRKIEHNIFQDLLNHPKALIISLGGGTPCYANNHLLLNKENVISVYLKASVSTLCNRLETEKNKRPLLASKTNEEMESFIAQHLFERSYFYNQAQHQIVVDNKVVTEIVAEINALFT